MLTNIYYYNNYRNQLLKNKSNSAKKIKQEHFSDNDIKNGQKNNSDNNIMMNKAYNSKVISYISDIASSINELKSSTNSIIKEFRSMNKSLKYKGEEETFNILKDEIDDFVYTYNVSTDVFNENVEDSNYLKDYYKDTKNILLNNERPLKSLGIHLDNNKKLSFNEEEFDSMTTTQKLSTLREVGQVFSNINEDTNEILKVPLTRHMEFKSFNYYFNYKINTTYNDTFKLVETGTLFDIAI